MAINLTFLSASLPLTKTIEKLSDGMIHKSPYPLITNFTSETIEVKNIQEFHAALLYRATHKRKPCLLKGKLTRELVAESRKGTTVTNDKTQWVCLDIDDARFSSPDEVMRALALDDISYVVQYSSSYKLGGSKNLSCHIFFLLDRPVSAPQLKAWLMHMNLSVAALESNITLSKSNAALHWPLDITTCQNDKLLYIAMPVFKGMVSPIGEDERIQLVLRKKQELSVTRLGEKAIEGLKQQAREKLNTLRAAAGIKPIRAKTKMVGEFEVQTGVGEVSTYETYDCGEYVRLNLNGGDSQAYWHFKADPTYLHNFKGEPSLLLKEVLPHYYGDLVRNAKDASTTPNKEGDLLLAFRDKVTATYWKGTWNADEHELAIYPVKSELQLDHFLQAHGSSLGAFVPEWHLTFDPQNPVVVDEAAKVVNTFIPTEYMRAGKKNKKGTFPTIQRVLDNVIGTGEIQDHFINWLAVIWQQRRKPLTAWVLSGTQGTGKGLLFHHILRPLFGRAHAVQKRAMELGSQFNGWLEQALVAFIDEVNADMFTSTNAKAVESDLKTMITEPTASIRRMRTDSYEVKNYTAFIFSSNEKRPVSIPMGDRRFNVAKFQENKLQITQQEIDGIENELEAFAHQLSTYKASFDRARSILQTEDRIEIQRRSITSIDELCNALTKGDLMLLWDSMPDEKLMEETGMIDVQAQAYAQLIRRISWESESDLTRDELELIFKQCVGKIPDGKQKFTSFLRHHGINLTRLRLGNGRTYGHRVKWHVSAEDRTILREMLDETKKSDRLKRVK